MYLLSNQPNSTLKCVSKNFLMYVTSLKKYIERTPKFYSLRHIKRKSQQGIVYFLVWVSRECSEKSSIWQEV